MVGTTISHYKVIEKIGQAGVLAVLMVFPLALSAQNPSALTTVWGPEEFVLSSDCKNATKNGVCRGSADVSLDGFGAPFMLHVRNGHEDGKNRVSRARIWLNGQLLIGRSDISQQKSGDLVKVIHQSVAEYALAVELFPARIPVTEPSSLRGSLDSVDRRNAIRRVTRKGVPPVARRRTAVARLTCVLQVREPVHWNANRPGVLHKRLLMMQQSASSMLSCDR